MGVAFTVGSLDQNNNCNKINDAAPALSMCYKTGQDSNWKCDAMLICESHNFTLIIMIAFNVFIYTAGYPRLEFTFPKPVVTSETLFQLKVNWQRKSFLKTKLFISNINIKEKNGCGSYKTINFADKG